MKRVVFWWVGWWGKNCSQMCECQHEGTCHHVTGECSCPHGYTGHNCQTGGFIVQYVFLYLYNIALAHILAFSVIHMVDENQYYV